MAHAIIPPLGRELQLEYIRFGPPGKEGRRPCRRTGDRKVDNQCAVRLCVALSRAKGFDILEYYTEGALHSDKCCATPDPYPHISSSETLFRHLKNELLFTFVEISGPASIQGKIGILFFEKVFTRKNGTKGNHIDYWDGATYTNEATGEGAPSGKLPMFEDAKKTWFCEL